MDKLPPSRVPLAGGSLLALCLVLGVVIGVAAGQPTIGFLSGLGAGLALLGAVWAIDRGRGG